MKQKKMLLPNSVAMCMQHSLTLCDSVGPLSLHSVNSKPRNWKSNFLALNFQIFLRFTFFLYLFSMHCFKQAIRAMNRNEL